MPWFHNMDIDATHEKCTNPSNHILKLWQYYKYKKNSKYYNYRVIERWSCSALNVAGNASKFKPRKVGIHQFLPLFCKWKCQWESMEIEGQACLTIWLRTGATGILFKVIIGWLNDALAECSYSWASIAMKLVNSTLPTGQDPWPTATFVFKREIVFW